MEESDQAVCCAAVKRIHEQSALRRVVLESKNTAARVAAVTQITDSDFLAKLAMEDSTSQICLAAVGRLEDQQSLRLLAFDAPIRQVRLDAIAKINLQAVLTRIALDNTYPLARFKAASLLSEQSLLFQVMTESKDWDVRQSVFNKLDHDQLNQLARATQDEAVLLAIAIKQRTRDWHSVFESVKLDSRKVPAIVGAAGLVFNPAPQTADVLDVCHTLIRKGDATRIPELCDLLNRFGDKRLAEDYLNCGQKALNEAARQWGQKQGLVVLDGDGSHRARWGEAAK